jgi:type II restriction enzyme
MRHALATWEVRDLLLIPSFMFSESAVIKRKPLAATARRAGWVGCNIALNRVPADARIFLVQTVASSRRRTGVTPVSDLKKSEYGDRQDACPTQTIIVSPEEVRAQFKRVKPLKDISVTQRGWTLDVLNVVRRLVSVSAPLQRDESEGRAPRDPNISDQMGRRGTPPSDSFTTADVYAFERELEQLHPDNRNVRPKIRQQLQILRDTGLLIHIDRGEWRLP